MLTNFSAQKNVVPLIPIFFVINGKNLSLNVENKSGKTQFIKFGRPILSHPIIFGQDNVLYTY